MTMDPDTSPEERAPASAGDTASRRRPAAWAIGIVGCIAAFLGLFALFGGEDQYLGIGGDWSWRVGDISAWWAYGLLIGGAAFLVAALVIAFARQGRKPV